MRWWEQKKKKTFRCCYIIFLSWSSGQISTIQQFQESACFHRLYRDLKKRANAWGIGLGFNTSAYRVQWEQKATLVTDIRCLHAGQRGRFFEGKTASERVSLLFLGLDLVMRAVHIPVRITRQHRTMQSCFLGIKETRQHIFFSPQVRMGRVAGPHRLTVTHWLILVRVVMFSLHVYLGDNCWDTRD